MEETPHMEPIANLQAAEARGIKYVLTDIDDTITTNAMLTADAYRAVWRLHEAGFVVIPVTGRAAGRCDIISREWPVDAVIAESGGVVFWEEKKTGETHPYLHIDPNPKAVRNTSPVLERIKTRALAEVPGCRPARDQFSRLYDMSIDYAEESPLTYADALKIRAIAREEGARANISSIHVNIWLGDYDKLATAEWFLQKRYGWKPGPASAGGGDGEVFYMGDAPNDEPMFARFPLACAVANIARYKGQVTHYPRFVARHECGEGFCEIVNELVTKHQEI
jgi:HAD superfamily hydrolase (TIGR01484 family)